MTDSIGTFAGIGSGVDYRSLVDQIIRVDSQPATRIQSRIDAVNAQMAAFKTYSGLISNLGISAKLMRDGSAFGGVNTNVSNATSAGGRTLLGATSVAGATPGSYAVQVLQMAQAEKLSGSTFASNLGAVGIVGEFVVNGKAVSIAATDSLTGIRDRINAVNTGVLPSGVAASVVTDASNAQRLVLTSQKTGAAGIDILDGAEGVARQLGWIDSTQNIKHVTSAGAQSDSFVSSSASIASQLGLSNPPAAQTVTVGGQTVSLDLGSDSLSTISTKLSGLTGITASVQSTTAKGVTKYYLDVRNTTSFVDTANTLGQLGILGSGRSAVAQTVQGAALTAGDASTPAVPGTLLSDIWNGGAASGARVGDTLNITGMRGDGSAVTTSFTIASGSTVQDLLTVLNDSTSGFGKQPRPATASIDAAGHIVVSDGTAGQSSLNLQIVANNQGGGRLDLGSFDAANTGRSRELVSGADARFTLDGVAFTRASNTVLDVLADTALTLTAADPTAMATVTVERSASAAQGTMQSYVDAYNKVVDFIKQQQTAGTATSGNPPLYGDSTLRSARSALSHAMLTSINGASPDLATAGMAGISLTKDGHISLDSAKFSTAFTTRFEDLQKLFTEHGTSSSPALLYSSSTSATQSGSYDVNVTHPATQAQLTGAGFSGVYSDDGTPDVMTVTDLSGNGNARVQLSNGMTTAQIVDAMNTAFSTPQPQVVRAAVPLNESSGATATAATLVTDLRTGGSPSARITLGDTVSFSGVRPNGIPYNGSFTVGPSSSVADLDASIQSTLGSSANVSFADGKLSVTSASTGTSPLSMTISAGNQGGGGFDFGSFDVAESGHGALGVKANVVGGQIVLTHGSYGSSAGIGVAYAGGGADGTAQLGLTAGSVRGDDVAGTVGGYAATGSGQQLVGATGSPAEGLSVGYVGTLSGVIGSVGLSIGVGAVIDRLVNSWSDVGGTVSSEQLQLSDQISVQQKRLDNFSARMEVRRQALLKQYLAMDTAVQRLRSQGSALLSAIGSGTRTGTA
ncbi:MAG: flagellar filament capping protein FliD [Gemmatimonadaceae bacterium]